MLTHDPFAAANYLLACNT